MAMVPSWSALFWVVVGVLVSSVLPAAVAALWPGAVGEAMRGYSDDALALFWKLWPGLRFFIFALVVALAAMAAAEAIGQPLELWWQALLVGVGADRIVQILRELRQR